MIFRIILVILTVLQVCVLGCKVHTTVLRQLRKEGFHLELLSTVEIIVESELCPNWEDCTLALVENISSSFFVNPDELRRDRIKHCIIESAIDTEKPQNSSPLFKVNLYSNPSRTLNLIHSDLKLPLHLRYHSVRKGGGYILTGLVRPSLLLQCPDGLNYTTTRSPCPSCSTSLCDWVELPFKTNAENLTVAVPVGDSDHTILVAILSYLLAFGGVIYLCLSVLQVVSLK